VHSNPPWIFLHFACSLHPPLFVKHSSISFFLNQKKSYWSFEYYQIRKLKSLPLQEKPVPEYCGLQIHEKLPCVFVQIAFTSHPPWFVKHSSMSVLFFIGWLV